MHCIVAILPYTKLCSKESIEMLAFGCRLERLANLAEKSTQCIASGHTARSLLLLHCCCGALNVKKEQLKMVPLKMIMRSICKQEKL